MSKNTMINATHTALQASNQAKVIIGGELLMHRCTSYRTLGLTASAAVMLAVVVYAVYF